MHKQRTRTVCQTRCSVVEGHSQRTQTRFWLGGTGAGGTCPGRPGRESALHSQATGGPRETAGMENAVLTLSPGGWGL